MRYVDRGACPPDLDPINPCDKVKLERAKVLAQFGGVDLGDTDNMALHQFNFKEHRFAADRLDELFLRKCAYCEDQLRVGADPQVEHFRPKGAVCVGGRNRKPGYYWLATDWSNLTLCCPICNQQRNREVVKKHFALRGKGTLFPIADEAKRAKKPGDEHHEVPLLLNPCKEPHPERFFVFSQDGTIGANPRGTPEEQRMAKETIDVFGLDRFDLCNARRAAIILAIDYVEQIRKALSRKRILRSDLDTALNAAARLSTSFLSSTCRFSAALRQVVLPKLVEAVGMPVPASLFDEPPP